jgi:hypothetical protein
MRAVFVCVFPGPAGLCLEEVRELRAVIEECASSLPL